MKTLFYRKGFTQTNFPVETQFMGVEEESAVVSKYSRPTYRENLRGFTLIEIIVVISIAMLVTVIAYTSFSNLNRSQALDKELLSVVSILNEARSLTLSSKNDSQYGVHFEVDKVVLFTGSVYTSGASTNISTNLNPAVSITAIALGGGSDVVFQRLSGNANQTGTVTLTLKASPGTSRTVTIFATGIIEASP